MESASGLAPEADCNFHGFGMVLAWLGMVGIRKWIRRT